MLSAQRAQTAVSQLKNFFGRVSCICSATATLAAEGREPGAPTRAFPFAAAEVLEPAVSARGECSALAAEAPSGGAELLPKGSYLP